jgi:N-acetylmuramic acid 6-phosphate (MurNAc-6-P) etherase
MSPNKQSLASITELPNELTRDIDIASPVGIVRLFRQSDTQIAAGYSEYPALLDEEIVEKIERCIHALCEVLTFKGPRRIVLSGAGTSGRLSTYVCREYNRRLAAYGHDPVFRPLMAGGPLALIVAQEGAEDDPIQGVEDLKGVLGDAERVLLFGVTCGFSAPYIAGQLEYCMDREGMTGVLLGFNPVERARRAEVENWDKSFGDVVDRMMTHPRALFLTPVVGPEPITGSTRMKGGSATKMLLDIAIGLALVYSELIPEKAYRLPYDRNDLRGTILALIDGYERARLEVYRQCESIGRLVELGGESLRQEGNLYYVGKDAFGILGLIDASECPPTFGANFSDVRGFVEGGWETLMGPGNDLSDQGPLYQITPQDFARNLLPQAGPRTLVTGLGEGGSSEWLDRWLEPASKQGAKTVKVVVNPVVGKEPYLDLSIGLEIDPPGFLGIVWSSASSRSNLSSTP